MAASSTMLGEWKSRCLSFSCPYNVFKLSWPQASHPSHIHKGSVSPGVVLKCRNNLYIWVRAFTWAQHCLQVCSNLLILCPRCDVKAPTNIYSSSCYWKTTTTTTCLITVCGFYPLALIVHDCFCLSFGYMGLQNEPPKPKTQSKQASIRLLECHQKPLKVIRVTPTTEIKTAAIRLEVWSFASNIWKK